MPTFRIYNVVDKTTGAIVKIGSTMKTIRQRASAQPYRDEKYRGCELVLREEFEWPQDDENFGLILCRIREQMRISQEHVWWDERGWNIDEPVASLLNGFDDLESRRRSASLGGRVIGKINKESGHMRKLGKKFGPTTGTANCKQWAASSELKEFNAKMKENNEGIFAPGVQIRAAVKAGQTNKESGHMAALGRKFGPVQGVANLKRWIGTPEHIAMSKKLCADKEHQVKAATAAGKIARESGQISALGKRVKKQKLGIFSPDWDRSEQNRRRHAKMTPEQRSAHGRYMNHSKNHVKKNVISPDCTHCCLQEKAS